MQSNWDLQFMPARQKFKPFTTCKNLEVGVLPHEHHDRLHLEDPAFLHSCSRTFIARSVHLTNTVS